MISDVASAPNKTLACVRCGGWNATWTSKFTGADVDHDGDLAQWCPDCSTVFDVTLANLPDGFAVRMSPEDVTWYSRRIFYHAGRADWDENCPDSAMVHVGAKETSMWLARHEGRKALYTVRVVGQMPKRLGKDQVDRWGRYSLAYVNAWETPGRVSLYLPKSRLEIVDKVKL